MSCRLLLSMLVNSLQVLLTIYMGLHELKSVGSFLFPLYISSIFPCFQDDGISCFFMASYKHSRRFSSAFVLRALRNSFGISSLPDAFWLFSFFTCLFNYTLVIKLVIDIWFFMCVVWTLSSFVCRRSSFCWFLMFCQQGFHFPSRLQNVRFFFLICSFALRSFSVALRLSLTTDGVIRRGERLPCFSSSDGAIWR